TQVRLNRTILREDPQGAGSEHHAKQSSHVYLILITRAPTACVYLSIILAPGEFQVSEIDFQHSENSAVLVRVEGQYSTRDFYFRLVAKKIDRAGSTVTRAERTTSLVVPLLQIDDGTMFQGYRPEIHVHDIMVGQMARAG